MPALPAPHIEQQTHGIDRGRLARSPPITSRINSIEADRFHDFRFSGPAPWLGTKGPEVRNTAAPGANHQGLAGWTPRLESDQGILAAMSWPTMTRAPRHPVRKASAGKAPQITQHQKSLPVGPYI